jgi:hypothetical protein
MDAAHFLPSFSAGADCTADARLSSAERVCPCRMSTWCSACHQHTQGHVYKQD